MSGYVRNKQFNLSVKKQYSFLKILTGSDLSRRRLPFMSAESPNEGPTIWLTACGHGDEVCGIVIIQEIFKKISSCLLRGRIHAFPLMNPIGFETASRNITESKEDLNRSFPGDSSGSLGSRIAEKILNRILETSPSLVLDLHNDWTKSIPYILIDNNNYQINEDIYKKTEMYARKTGFVVIADTEELTSTLTYNLLRKGVPALTLELGEPYVINERNVQFGIMAIWNVLASLGMIEPLESPFHYPAPSIFNIGKILKYSDKPYSSTSGIIRFLSKPGDEVKKGQAFAQILNTFGKNMETVRSVSNAIVLGHSDSSVAFPGMHIMAFGTE